MWAWLRQRRELRQKARSLYGSIVAQARSPGLYARWGVPDTPEGRFEMIALHLTLALRRLSNVGEPGRALGQALTEAFVVDLDDALREMTVGDLAVPRQVKHAVAVLHTRHATYGTALDSPEAGRSLAEAVGTQLASFGGAEGLDVIQICAYIREAARALELQGGAEIRGGHLLWPQILAGADDRTGAD